MARIGILNEAMERRRNAEPALWELMSSSPGMLESGRRAVRGNERDGDGGRRRQIGGGRAGAGSGATASARTPSGRATVDRCRWGCHDCRVAGARGEGAG